MANRWNNEPGLVKLFELLAKAQKIEIAETEKKLDKARAMIELRLKHEKKKNRS